MFESIFLLYWLFHNCQSRLPNSLYHGFVVHYYPLADACLYCKVPANLWPSRKPNGGRIRNPETSAISSSDGLSVYDDQWLESRNNWTCDVCSYMLN